MSQYQDMVSININLSTPASSSSSGGGGKDVKQYNFVLGHGQSLSIGDQGFPLTHTMESFGEKLKLFNGLPPIGAGYEVGIQSADMSTLINYKEQVKETHAWSMFNWLKEEGHLNDTTIYAACGVGGKNIKKLTIDENVPSWGIGNVNKVIAKVNSLGDITIPFSTWIHGEADSVNPDQEGYKIDLRNYHDNIMATSGQTFPLFLDQTGKSSSYHIADTLLEYTDENADSYLAGPKYWLNRLYPEATGLRLHLNAEGYMLQGEMIGKAISEVYKGVNFKPFQPLTLQVVPNTNFKQLDIRYHIPHGGSIVEDESLSTQTIQGGGLGLRYYEGFSKKLPTYVINGDTIRYTFEEPIDINGEITMGNELDDRVDTDNVKLPYTNLRGSVGHTSKALSGVTFYDWCCQFRRVNIAGAMNREVDNLWMHGDFNGTLAANETGLGRNPEWLLLDIGDVLLTCDVIGTSGTMWIWIYNTRVILTEGFNSVVVPEDATRRMYLQGSSGGFTGTVSNISITKNIP